MKHHVFWLIIILGISSCNKKSNDTYSSNSNSIPNINPTNNNSTKNGMFYTYFGNTYQECYSGSGFNGCATYGTNHTYSYDNFVRSCTNSNKPFSIGVNFFLPFDTIDFKKILGKKLPAFDGYIPDDKCNKDYFGIGCGCSAFDTSTFHSYSIDTLYIDLSATSKTSRYESNTLLRPTTIRDTSKYYFRVNKMTFKDYGYHYVEYQCNIDYNLKMRNADNYKDTFDLSGMVNGVTLQFCTNGKGGDCQ